MPSIIRQQHKDEKLVSKQNREEGGRGKKVLKNYELHKVGQNE